MKKLALFIILFTLCVAGAYVLYEKKTAAPKPNVQTQQEKNSSETPNPQKLLPNGCPTSSATVGIAAGRYEDYSEEAAKQHCFGYDRTILFFYAPWCPECRGFEKVINAGTVPDGVQILKVDYDSSTELKKKYGVTIQSTFVSVDKEGNKRTLWTGYGKDKSVDAILENTQ